MDAALDLLFRPAFYGALAIVFPLMSGALTATTHALERLELRLDASRQGWVAQLFVWALGRLMACWNEGPRTLSGWGLLLLSLAAVIVATGCGGPETICGHSYPPPRPATLQQVQELTADWCLREANAIDREVLDPEARAHAQSEHATYCDVLLSILPGSTPREEDDE